MEEADVKVCNELHGKANDFGRAEEIKMAIPAGNSWVLVRNKEIMYVSQPSLLWRTPHGCDPEMIMIIKVYLVIATPVIF